MSNGSVIHVDSLTRRFGDFTAVDEVTFDVRKGELFGFLGPNGAGKTTTINMLCTLLKPTLGTATVNGFDIRKDRNAVRSSIGLIFQDPTLDDRLTGMQNLRFHSLLYDQERSLFEERSRELLAMVDLTEKAGEKVGNYSGGMKRRLEIARGLLHRPHVLFLDEPTIGLDPQTRWHIWDYLNRVRESEKTTLFLTTHYMDEAEHCDRIAIIDHGKIIALDTPTGLKSLVGGDLVTYSTSDNEKAARIVNERLGLQSRPGPDGTLVVETDHGDRLIPRLSAAFDPSSGIELLSVSLSRPTIEDVFIKLTGRTIREEEASDREKMKRHGFGHGRRR